MSVKFTTFAITIRPRNGVTQEHIDKFAKFVYHHCKYWYIITEKEDDERHIHSALFFNKELTRSNVTTYMVRLFKELDKEERDVIVKGCKILYNNDFIEKYMDKDDNTVVIDKHLPEMGILESFYPPKPVPKKQQAFLHMHSTMYKYEEYWRQYMSPIAEVNTCTVRDFLFALQYKHRVIGLLDDKRLTQHAKWFVRWYNKAESCPSFFLPAFEIEEGTGVHGARVSDANPDYEKRI